MSKLRKRLRALWRRRQLDHDLDEELRFHLEMKAAEMGDFHRAHRRVGNTTALKERCRDQWSFAALESWWQDIRYASRMLAKTPGFTVVAIIALALGIGADTGIFTIANGAFSWDMGLDRPDRVVLVSLTDASRRQEFGASYQEFRDLRDRTKSLTDLAAYQFVPVNLSDNRATPERYWCVKMSAGGFADSGQKPLIGRTFSTNDARPGTEAVVVLTYHVWQDRYGNDPGILRKRIRVNEVPTTVIGVMPPGKRFPEETDLWVPLTEDPQTARSMNSAGTLFGRLRDGVSMDVAQAELSRLVERLAKEDPATNQGVAAKVETIAQLTGVYNARPFFVALWLAVGFVLLIACADVANMLLARGAGRVREVSIRVAIGAGRTRIVRQLLIESMLLAIAGGFFGWLAALGYLRWFDIATSTATKPVWLKLSLDRTAYLYMTAVSMITGILFGLAPAVRLSRIDVHSAMKDGGQGIARGRRAVSVSNLLVVAEMSLCIVLLAGAGLMIHSTVNLYSAPLGVNSANVLTAHVNLPEAKYPLNKDETDFHRTLKRRLDALPGVETSAVTSNLPVGRWLTFQYELREAPIDARRWPQIGAIVVSPSYFHVLRVKPRLGRIFTENDGISGPPVAIVNESFVNKYWRGENAVGKRLRLVKDAIPQQWLTVVGVLPDILQNFQRPLEHDPLIYLAYAEEPQREVFLIARTSVPPAGLAAAFRKEVQQRDPNLALFDVRTLEDRLAQTRLSTTVLGAMFSVFAAIALVLAGVGLYAVIAHSVSERTQEIGIRMAVGGSRTDILRMVYAQGLRPVLLGVAFGVPAAVGIAHLLQRALIGVSPGDPMTFALVGVALMAAAFAGCAIPARRAVRVDPIVALRYE